MNVLKPIHAFLVVMFMALAACGGGDDNNNDTDTTGTVRISGTVNQ